MSVYIKSYFSSVWGKRKKRISWQKQIGKNEKLNTNRLCKERTARPVVCPDFVCRADTVVSQWILSSSNLLWYGKVKPKGGRTEKSRSSPKQGKHTVALCGQNNTTASTLHQTVLQWIPSNSNVVWCGKLQPKGQENRSTTIKEVKIMTTARQMYCGVVSLGKATRQHPHYSQILPLPSAVKKGASDYQIQARYWPQPSEPSFLYQVKN